MEHTTLAESASLFLIIAYYATHSWHEIRHTWRRSRRKIVAARVSRRWVACIMHWLMMVVIGCMQAGPVAFYCLHLAATDYTAVHADHRTA